MTISQKYTVGFEKFQAYLLGQKDGVPKTLRGPLISAVWLKKTSLP